MTKRGSRFCPGTCGLSKRRGDRTGATLVLVALLLTAIVGIAGIAIDFARIYVMKNQLQTTSDASAIAAAMQLALGQPLTATDTALTYGTRNTVNRDTADILPADVEPGSFSDAAGFVPQADGDWTDANVTAVRVTARYSADYMLARVFGSARLPLAATAVAALSYIGETSCIKPWAIPYSALLMRLGQDPADVAYNLTAEDIEVLRTNSRAYPIGFKPGAPGQALWDPNVPQFPGNFYIIQFPPYYRAATNEYQRPEGGAAEYRARIAMCTPESRVGIGDTLLAQQGNIAGPTERAVDDWCRTNGGTGLDQATGKCNGDAGMPMKAAIWDSEAADENGRPKVHVKYLGAFVITTYDAGTATVYGFFDYLITEGTLTTRPTGLGGRPVIAQ